MNVSGIDTRQLDLVTAGFESLGREGKQRVSRATLNDLWIYITQEIRSAWVAVKATGGTYRGETWEGMKDQYTRKTDGVTVPAWGGVPYLDRIKSGGEWVGNKISWTKAGRARTGQALTSKGGRKATGGHTVKGKKRPSGQRVSGSSVMMQDTGDMRNSALASPRKRTDYELRIGPKGVSEEYASIQDDRRPAFFWTDANRTWATNRLGTHIAAEVRRRILDV